jgi:hypothetical protein
MLIQDVAYGPRLWTAREPWAPAAVNVSVATCGGRFSAVDRWRFWVSTEDVQPARRGRGAGPIARRLFPPSSPSRLSIFVTTETRRTAHVANTKGFRDPRRARTLIVSPPRAPPDPVQRLCGRASLAFRRAVEGRGASIGAHAGQPRSARDDLLFRSAGAVDLASSASPGSRRWCIANAATVATCSVVRFTATSKPWLVQKPSSNGRQSDDKTEWRNLHRGQSDAQSG